MRRSIQLRGGNAISSHGFSRFSESRSLAPRTPLESLRNPVIAVTGAKNERRRTWKRVRDAYSYSFSLDTLFMNAIPAASS